MPCRHKKRWRQIGRREQKQAYLDKDSLYTLSERISYATKLLYERPSTGGISFNLIFGIFDAFESDGVWLVILVDWFSWFSVLRLLFVHVTLWEELARLARPNHKNYNLNDSRIPCWRFFHERMNETMTNTAQCRDMRQKRFAARSASRRSAFLLLKFLKTMKLLNNDVFKRIVC